MGSEPAKKAAARRGADRVPPHNLAAEESLIGSCLISSAARDAVVDLVTFSDFYKPGHQYVYDCIVALHRALKPVDVVTVAESLRESGLLAEVGGLEFLQTLVHATPATSNAARYAEIVVRTSQHRALIAAAAELIEKAYREDDVAETILDGQAALEMVGIKGGSRVTYMTGREFMDEPPDEYDWVQPFIIETLDRFLLTGGEGSGKSIALLQWAVMTACGVHWWTRTPVPAKRCTYIDLELGKRRNRRRAELFAEAADWASDHWRDNLTVYSKPEDIDLSTRAGASFVASIVERSEPDLLIIGPIYRLTSGVAKAGDIGGEDAAKRAAFALDKIVERCNCALLAETHAAKGEIGRGRDLRPFGSSVWTRWPEFGHGLVRQAADAIGYDEANRELIAWRGDRDPREWPNFFTISSDPGDWRLQAQFNKRPDWFDQVVKAPNVNIRRQKGNPDQEQF